MKYSELKETIEEIDKLYKRLRELKEMQVLTLLEGNNHHHGYANLRQYDYPDLFDRLKLEVDAEIAHVTNEINELKAEIGVE